MSIFKPYHFECKEYEVNMEKVYCKNCRLNIVRNKMMVEYCFDHPDYFHNKNNNCKFYKKKWWKFWVKKKEKDYENI